VSGKDSGNWKLEIWNPGTLKPWNFGTLEQYHKTMQLLPLIIVSVLLSFVPFSVAVSSSVYRCIEWKEALRIAFVFAFFQAGMISIGWVIGFGIKGLFYSMATPVAVLIMFYIGFRMFMDSWRLGRENRTMAVESNRILYGFAFVTSINTALLGMGLGILYKDILYLAAFLFVATFIMSILGIKAGKRAMMNLGKTAEMTGGVGLAVISLIILLQYLKIL
jgi:manganese efflux pump family protein